MHVPERGLLGAEEAHVRLVAVHTALGDDGGGEPVERRERLVVRLCAPAPAREHLLHAVHLCAPERALDVRQPEVEAEFVVVGE
jgi:hypothetical protein